MNVRCLARISGISHDSLVARSARAVARDPRQRLVAAPVAIGSLRLGSHIAVRRLESLTAFAMPATTKGSGHMSFVSRMIGTAERVPLPDVIIRAAIQRLCSRTATRLASAGAASDAAFAGAMAARAIADHTGEADARHHQVPATFFAQVLGPNRKYSSCFYKEPASTLQEAEEEALRQTIEHADLADGQAILELGCGWGSLALSMARQYPNAEITAVSNSPLQREYIEQVAASRGLMNIRVVTAHERVRPTCAVRPHRVG